MESLVALVMPLIEKYPFIATVLMVIGTLRAINKPLFVFLHAFSKATESKKDDKVVADIEASKGYKSFVFIMDYLASVKLIK